MHYADEIVYGVCDLVPDCRGLQDYGTYVTLASASLGTYVVGFSVLSMFMILPSRRTQHSADCGTFFLVGQYRSLCPLVGAGRVWCVKFISLAVRLSDAPFSPCLYQMLLA